MTVAEFLLLELKKNNVSDIFGIPGGVVLEFLYAADAMEGIDIHLSYHEQAAAFEACGYAQVEHSLGVAYSTRGPGFTNMITGIADAYADSIPVLFITGHAGKHVGHNQRFEQEQEMDTVQMVKYITKYADTIETVDEAEKKIKDAIWNALNGRKGPVFLDVSSYLWNKTVDIMGYVPKENNHNNCLDIQEIKFRLKAAKRPLILIGDGVRQSGTVNDLVSIIKNSSVPVISSRGAQDIISDYEGYYGYIGSHGIRYANNIFVKSDFVLSLGNRLSFPMESQSFMRAFENKTIVRIDNDLDELKRSIPNSLSIRMELKDFIDIFKLVFDNYVVNSSWLLECEGVKKQYLFSDTNSITEFLCTILSKTPDVCVVADVGNNEFWTSRAYELSNYKHRMLYSKSFGTLGCAIGKSIGAYYKLKEKIICVVGDQGFQFNIQELELISKDKLPILVIIINNKASGMIKDREKVKKKFVHTTFESGYGNPNFKYIAKAYNIDYLCLCNAEDLKLQDLSLPMIIEYTADGSIGLEPSLPRGNTMDNMHPAIIVGLDE